MNWALLVAVFIAIVGRLMADEVKAWLVWLHECLRRMAVARLPAECRDRYDEEWASGIVEVPGEIFKLFYSLGLLRASAGIRKAALKSAVELDKGFELSFDALFAFLTLIVFSPLLLAIAIAIKLESPGPVFYASERIGKKAKIFRCMKFRTMVPETYIRRDAAMHVNERDDVLLKLSSRITPIGRFLRKYSLDELPQLFNVLKGDMRIVGPRAPLAREVRKYDLKHLRRFDVTPGITGLWQVQDRMEPLSSNGMSLDEFYVKHRSLWLDLRIIARTIWLVFTGRIL